MNWARIIVYILALLLEGLSKNKAATRASGHFSVSVEEILKHL